VPVGLNLDWNAVMIARPTKGADLALLRRTVTTAAQPVLKQTADRLRQEARDLAAEVQERAGREVTGELPGLAGCVPFNRECRRGVQVAG
jgi:predicted nucleic acid-binding Zn ribbon protein